MLALASCAGSSSNGGDQHLAAESLTGRLNQRHGYQVDEQGNWVPRTNKRSQYEGRGGSAYFNGAVAKKSFQAETLRKGSWMGAEQVNLAEHRLSGAESRHGGRSRFSSEESPMKRNLRTPERIEGNRLTTDAAREGATDDIGRPSDAETDVRRRVFRQPDVIDYRQQRELSIQQSKELLGRDD